MGTQKNRLAETALLSTQNILKLMGKTLITILCSNVLFNCTYELHICMNMYVSHVDCYENLHCFYLQEVEAEALLERKRLTDFQGWLHEVRQKRQVRYC